MRVGSHTSVGLVLCQLAVAIQLVPANFSTPLLPEACIQSLKQSVACNSSLTWAAADGRFEYDTTLNHLCQDSCHTALTEWKRNVGSKCGSSWFNTANGYAMSPSYFPEFYLERYTYACVKDSSGKLCNTVLRDLIGVDPQGQNITKSPTTTGTPVQCADCNLCVIQAQLAMPLQFDAKIGIIFRDLVTSCGKTQFTVPPIPTNSFIRTSTVATKTSTGSHSSTTTATSTCDGKIHKIVPTDTCQLISLQERISAFDLARVNHLDAFCQDFPISGSLCIPSSTLCTPYVVGVGNDCTTIANAYNTSWTQIVSWNPTLGPNCERIVSHISQVVCVSPPGGGWINHHVPGTSKKPPMTDTTTTTFTNTIPLTPISVLPTMTRPDIDKNYTIPFAPGTPRDCYDYIWETSNLTCSFISSFVPIAIDKFWDLNPRLPRNATCTIEPNMQYCIHYLPPEQSSPKPTSNPTNTNTSKPKSSTKGSGG